MGKQEKWAYFVGRYTTTVMTLFPSNLGRPIINIGPSIFGEDLILWKYHSIARKVEKTSGRI
jgi:hypothetical protein